MLHVCAVKFDVMENLEKFLVFDATKRGLSHWLLYILLIYFGRLLDIEYSGGSAHAYHNNVLKSA